MTVLGLWHTGQAAHHARFEPTLAGIRVLHASPSFAFPVAGVTSPLGIEGVGTLDAVAVARALLAKSFICSENPGTTCMAFFTAFDDASSCHGLPWLSASTNRSGNSLLALMEN